MDMNLTMNLNFNSKKTIMERATKFRVPGIDNTTIVTDVFEKGSGKITGLTYRIMKKGKVLEEKAYHNKKGFKPERLGKISMDIQKRVKEGFDFLTELFEAQFKSKI